MKPPCPHCKSILTKKNGHTHYGKQNHRCKVCNRQFVVGGQAWFIPDATKKLVDNLLLERIPLAGIVRVTGVSEQWLLSYIKKKYKELPDDLNADLSMPELTTYLEDRFEEEIVRLETRKPAACKKYTAVTACTVSAFEEETYEEDPSKELLINEVYSKERGARIQVFGIQLDEMWSFVQKKANKQWIWLALNPANRQIVAFHVGGRGKTDAQIFYDAIPDLFKQEAAFFTDYWKAYACILPEEKHFAVGKDSGLTAYIERFNCTLRQRVSRLVRSALSFSKSITNCIEVIKYFICQYNLNIKALHL